MKSIANQYRDLKEGKMSEANFMRNLRMTMPQFVTNVTSFGDAVRILKNKSIIVESAVKEEFRGFYHNAIEAASGDKISHTEEDDNGDPIYWSTKNPYVNYYIGSNDQIIKYDGKTGERYPIGDLGDYDQNKPDEFPFDYDDFPSKDDYDADYEEPRDDFDMAEGEGDEDAMYDAMIKKIEDELAAMQAANAQYDEALNEAKKPNVEKAEDENLEEVTLGIFMEHACFPDKSYEEIEKIVKKNIKKNPNYYTNYKLTGIRDYEVETMDSSKPEDHQMKFYTEKTAVDTARGMQKVKMPKKEEKKKLKESVDEAMPFADLPADPEKYKIVRDSKGYIIKATNADGVEFQKGEEVTTYDGEKIKIAKFEESQGKVKAIYNAGMFFRSIDIDGLEASKDTFRPGVDMGGSFEKMKKSLEEIVREVMNEYYDGRDNLIDPIAAEENN